MIDRFGKDASELAIGIKVVLSVGLRICQRTVFVGVFSRDSIEILSPYKWLSR